MSVGRTQAQKNAVLEAGLSDLTQGVCVSVDWPNRLAVVNIGGGQVAIPMVFRAPFPGDAVWVGYLGKKPICLGTIPKAATGTVLAGTPVDGIIQVAGDDSVTYGIPVYGTPPAPGSRVGIDWAPNGVVVGVLSAEPAGVEPRVPASAAPVSSGGSKTFRPVWSGRFYIPTGDWNGSDPWASPNQIGAFGYGTSVGDTIPDGATIEEARVFVSEYSSPYPTSTSVGTHSLSGPAGTPSVSNGTAMSGGDGWKNISIAAANALKNGSAKGISATGGGFRKWSSAGVNNSGALYVRWS